MTDVVARLRQLEAAATPAPWEAMTDDDDPCVVEGETDWETNPGGDPGSVLAELSGGEGADRWWNQQGKEDARLIAAARNALPQLLAIAEAARRLSRHAANPLNCDCPRIGSLIEHVHEIDAALAALDSQETE